MSYIKIKHYWRISSRAAIGLILLGLFQNCGEAFEAKLNPDNSDFSSVAPTVSITQAPVGLITSRDVAINFKVDSSSAIASITCQLDNNPAVTCKDVYQVTGAMDGDHLLTVTAVDARGKKVIASAQWRSDSTKPVAIINQAPAAMIGQAGADLIFSSTDNFSGVATVECSLDNANFAACASPLKLSNLVEKNYSFRVRAFDVAGNVSDIVAATWQVDLSMPVINITSGPPNISNSTTATFTFSGTDGGMLLTDFQCEMDNGGLAACVSPKSFTGLAQGSHTFKLSAKDSVGNVSATVLRTFTVDSIAPTVVIVSSPSDFSPLTNVSFQFTPNDGAGSGIVRSECSLNDEAFAACSSPKGYANLANGNFKFAVRAVDNAGNISQPVVRLWRIDSVAPVVSISSSVPATTASTSATMTIAASDINGSGVKSIECKLDAANFATCTNPISYSALALGVHTFAVRATDAAGNVSAIASYSWMITPVTPALVAQLSWDVNTETDLAGYKLYYGTNSTNLDKMVDVGLATVANGRVSYTLQSNLVAGQTFYFAVSAYDRSGNESQRSGLVMKSY